jgi:hypothetical protein
MTFVRASALYDVEKRERCAWDWDRPEEGRA